MNIQLVSRIRSAFADYLPVAGMNDAVAMNSRRDLCAVQSLPPKTELVRLGNSWLCTIATGSAFTYVNAWPTTRAELVLFNGATAKSNSPTYAIDYVFMSDVTSAAAAQSKALLVQNVAAAPGNAGPTNDTAQLINSLSGKPNYNGQALRAVANTSYAVANKWDAVASTVTANTATIGTTVQAELYGKYLVPPGGAFCLAGLAGTAAGTAIIGVAWHELVLDLG